MRILLFMLLFVMLPVHAQVMEGGVSKVGDVSRVVDTATRQPVSGAKVSLPKQNFTTFTDTNGMFNITPKLDDSSVLSVEKEGYRPFSLTINDKLASQPLVLGIEKSNVQDVVISTEMFHLGDDKFSAASANSAEFRAKSIGPFYSTTFMLAENALTMNNYLVIGSIIGIDTLLARSMRQNNIVDSFASPPEVYFNGRKIAEIQLNGDGQRIKLPNSLLRAGQMNEVIIRTGRNLKQTAYIDYDDIEFVNLSIQTE